VYKSKGNMATLKKERINRSKGVCGCVGGGMLRGVDLRV
jgi:hypothetical protein